MRELPSDLWAHPALAVFYGLGGLSLLVILALALARRLRPGIAAWTGLGAVWFAGGASLIAHGVRDCPSPTGFEDSAGRLMAECREWTTHPTAAFTGILLIAGGIGGAFALRALHRRKRRDLDWRPVARLLVGVFSAFLLLSLAGAQVVAAPFTIPALWLASRGASAAGRAALTLVAALTMTIAGSFTGWALNNGPAAIQFVLPPLLFVGTIVIFAGSKRTPRGA